MLELRHHLTLNEEAINSPNLATHFDDQDLQAIGAWVFQGYRADKQSRAKWEKRNEASMDLAMQLAKEKSFPWPNASNIAFPLVTIGAMQFHARAYPTIIQGTEVVEMRVVGPDIDGIAHNQADRISCHMSYQVLEEDRAWEEQHDRGLLLLAISGCLFFKTYYSPKLRHNVSELVLPKDLVINYWAKSVDECPRKTHVIPLSRNDIRERVLSGIYCNVLEETWYSSPARPQQTVQDLRSDMRTGDRPPYMPDEATPFYILEQHCTLDLDGDGYAEPYIISIEENSKCVLRIVSRVARIEDIQRVEEGEFKDQIISCLAEEYFTKYAFIPSPDGGIYDVGFGVLLGPLNESVNSLVNQLVDAGTMANTAGGFLARGAKIRGGAYVFSPFGWNRVDSTGDDLKKSIFPLPVREPSAVLFQLLGLLINYTNRISGATDTIVGENPGQNTPAQTTQTMVEMGMKIYSAIFKRVWRSMKEEFRKLYILNGTWLPDRVQFGKSGQEYIGRGDYNGDPNRIVPVADPNITSENQKMQQAMALYQLSRQGPGFNWEAVDRRVLKAMRIDSIDEIYPGVKSPNATPIPNPKAAVEQIKQQTQQAKLELDKMKFSTELQEEIRVNNAEIAKIEAQALLFAAEAQGVEKGHQVALINAMIGEMKLRNEALQHRVEMMLRGMEIDQKQQELEQPNPRTVGSMAKRPTNGAAA
jgi:chaperonin GroES